jgi:hypothetical protein
LELVVREATHDGWPLWWERVGWGGW